MSGGIFIDNQERVVVFENVDDDEYQLIFTDIAPGKMLGQSFAVARDLDNDGRDEILFGGVPGFATSHNVIAYEAIADDSYEMIWATQFSPVTSTSFLIDGGDLDGDGKREFLAGGMKPNSPFQCHLHIVETVADNEFQVVANLIRSVDLTNYCAANVADVDGDGRKEIAMGWGSGQVTLFANAGDNSWHEIWVGTGGHLVESIGAGDHDADGKEEILFRGGNNTNGYTGVWEIHPDFAADMDADDTVDAIDNCPAGFNPGQEDIDGDAVGDVCDNCVFGPNSDQGAAVLGQELVAVGAEAFGWATSAPVVYVRGGLAGIGSYAVDATVVLPMASGFVDAAVPEPGAGFWYLVKPDCAVGSWQSELGAEPGRDTALP